MVTAIKLCQDSISNKKAQQLSSPTPDSPQVAPPPRCPRPAGNHSSVAFWMSPGEELPFVNNSYKVVMVLRTLWVLRENIDLKPLRAFSVTQHKMEKRIRVKIISLFILISLGVIFIAVGVLFHIKYQVGKYCFFETRPLFTQRCFWYHAHYHRTWSR